MERPGARAQRDARSAVPCRDDLGEHRDRGLVGAGAAEVEAEGRPHPRDVGRRDAGRGELCGAVRHGAAGAHRADEPDREGEGRDQGGNIQSLVMRQHADGRPAVHDGGIEPGEVLVRESDDQLDGRREALARHQRLPHIAHRHREARGRGDAAQRRRVLAGADDR